MIDLETMSTNTPHVAIVSIGAVAFDPMLGFCNMAPFYVELDWEQQAKDGRHVQSETVCWWRKQSTEAQKALEGKEMLKDALVEFSKWLPFNAIVWGNGATFDISILEDAYKQCDLPIPWKFYNVRDCRTVADVHRTITGQRIYKKETPHHALEDAKQQVQSILQMYAELRQ